MLDDGYDSFAHHKIFACEVIQQTKIESAFIDLDESADHSTASVRVAIRVRLEID
jgi:hypothetical protein